MNDDNHFKISIVIISVILIVLWFVVTIWMIRNIFFNYFDWPLIAVIPSYLLVTLVTLVGGISGLLSQIEILRKK